jgi:methionyl-tRNA synthetase
MLEWENAGKSKLLSVGYSLREPQLLFRKIEDAEIAEQMVKLQATAVKAQQIKEESSKIQQQETTMEEAGTENENIKSQIVYEDFAKLDLRVGTIITASKVEKSDKLLKLEVDLGTEQRTIVSGIALHFKPEDITGKQVVVVANLAPRKMRGIESNGMILMAEDAAGKLHFVQPGERIEPGAMVS